MTTEPEFRRRMIAEADAGDLQAVVLILGHVGAYLSTQSSPPASLCKWLSPRLIKAASLLHPYDGKSKADKEALEAAFCAIMGIRRDRRGRPKRRSKTTDVDGVNLAGAVHHMLHMGGATSEPDAFAKVQQWHQKKRGEFIPEGRIKAAWTAHRKEFPQ